MPVQEVPTRTRTLRIAVLECDAPPDKINHKYGGYYGVFSKFLRESADALVQAEAKANDGLWRDDYGGGDDDDDSIVPQLDISRWDVVAEQAYPALEDVDAIVVSGSKRNAFDSPPWILTLVEFIQRALAPGTTPHIRILGVCFGHQIVARALGMSVARNPAGWKIAVCLVELTRAGKEVFGVERVNIHQMHRDAVVVAHPTESEINLKNSEIEILPLGHSAICSVQGLYAPGRFLTVQGHPEFTADIIEEIIAVRAAQDVFDAEQAADALGRAGMKHDGVLVGVAFLKMVMEL
ncbi:class I glutamine amidotransferase-like protein [Aspergillus pseudoustus]|uniref:Class I glutamine amidotransferase-like protein n=1 Tax=Aspergillus pseudoustus TaxID=1810923 RepID=A0ABR4JCD8_9EURO